MGNQSYVRSLHRNEDNSSGLVPEHAVKQAAWSQASRVRILTPSSCAESYDVITESGGIDLNGVC